MSRDDGTEARITGAEIIEEILRNMEEGLEPLKYTVLAHGVYRVVLHPQDYERLQGVFPRIRDEASRALDEGLARLNKPRRLPLGRLSLGGPKAKYESATGSWEIGFVADPDEELSPGDVVIVSLLAYPIEAGRGAGTPTRRIVTRRGEAGARVELTETPAASGAPTAGSVLARIQYEDAAGPHSFDMTKDQVVIGRGGATHWCDLQLDASHDVSREHVRLRRDPGSGRFFLKNMGRLGTTVDGVDVPRSIDETSGEKVDRNIEVELPPVAKIGLAGVFFLRFEAQERAGAA